MTAAAATAMSVSAHMLRNIRCFKRVLAKDSPQMEIMSRCYRDGSVAARDLAHHGNRHNLLGKLIAKRYLYKDGGVRYAARYGLTLLGKCKILCTLLDTSLLGLCILAEAHVMHGYQQEHGVEPSYVPQVLADSFDGLFSPRAIQNSTCVLCSKGLAYRTHTGVIRLLPGTVSVLGEHRDIVSELHEWIAGVRHSLDVSALGRQVAYRPDLQNGRVWYPTS